MVQDAVLPDCNNIVLGSGVTKLDALFDAKSAANNC